MAKKQKEQETETVPEPVWPVDGPDALTIWHVPTRLRDELVREWLASGRALGAFALELIDSRNDLLNAIAGVLKAGQKESDRLNKAIQINGIQASLQRFGVGAQPVEEARRA